MATVQKKSVLITGCSPDGIGQAMAKHFHAQNYYVFATTRNPSTSTPTSLTSLPDVEILELDVTLPHTIARCKDIVAKRTGGTLDVLVNNAGVEFNSPLLDTDVAEAKRLFDVNVWGVLAMVQGFAPLLIEAGGVVFNQSSIDSELNMVWAGTFSFVLFLRPSRVQHSLSSHTYIGGQANMLVARYFRQFQSRRSAHVGNTTHRARAARRARCDVHLRIRRHAHVREAWRSHGAARDVVLPRRAGRGVEGADGSPAPGYERRCACWKAGQGYCRWS